MPEYPDVYGVVWPPKEVLQAAMLARGPDATKGAIRNLLRAYLEELTNRAVDEIIASRKDPAKMEFVLRLKAQPTGTAEAEGLVGVGVTPR